MSGTEIKYDNDYKIKIYIKKQQKVKILKHNITLHYRIKMVKEQILI